MSWLATWRTALRIARREARRSRGRSALVVVMIAMPMLALSAAAVTYDMFRLTPDERADRIMGTADALIWWPNGLPTQQLPDPYGGPYVVAGGAAPTGGDRPAGNTDDLLAALPGARAIPLHRGAVSVRTEAGIGELNAVAVDAADPIANGLVEVLAGRAPRAPDEVAVTQQAAVRLGQGVGGTVNTADGARSFTVVGVVEFPSTLGEALLFTGVDAPTPVFFSYVTNGRSWLVDTPQPLTWDRVLELNRSGIVVASREVLRHPPPPSQVPIYENTAVPEELGLAALVGGLALLEIVLLAGPAFAVSARRRQRQLALVAANGGTPAHVRRIVLADGVVLGVVGAAAGIALGIAAAMAGRPLVEEYFYHARAGGYRVFPLALVAIAALAVVTGLLAALVPAFIAARQEVVTALAGRRGITRSRKRWLVVGLAMAALGTLVVVNASRVVDARMMLAGIIIGELGLVLCTPTLVGLVARLGRLMPPAPRIALRDAARNRAAAAPAISAVMAAVAGSVAIGLYFDSEQARQVAQHRPLLPAGYAQVWLGPVGDPSFSGATAEQTETVLRNTLPVSEVHRLGRVACPPGAEQGPECSLYPVMYPEFVCPYQELVARRALTTQEQRSARADPRCDDAFSPYGGEGLVDDGTALATLTGATGDDLAAAQAMLRSGGVVVRDPRFIKDGKATVAIVRYGGTKAGDPMDTAEQTTIDAYLLTTGVSGDAIFSPAAVARAGLDWGWTPGLLVASTTRMPTQDEIDRFQAQVQSIQSGGMVEMGPQVVTDGMLWVLIAAAALITLGAAAIGTGLAAADGRPDLSTLAAIGASPRLRRGLSLSQSGVIAGLGSLLGALAGLGAAVAILVALNQRFAEFWPGPEPYPIAVPWLSLGVALIVVPAIAMLGAGVLTRSRLPIERRL